MHIQVDADTTGAELFHLSILFQSLAGDRGFAVPKPERVTASQTQTIGEMSVTLNVDTANATSAVEALADLIDRTGVKVEDVPPVTYSVETPDINTNHASIDDAGTVSVHVTPPATDTNLDVNGLPWDARIHAGSRERNTDRSWRVRRKPKTVEQDEWDATLARVTAELTDLMAIPVSPGAEVDAAAEEALTDAEVDAFVDIVTGFDPAVPGGDVTVESTIKVSDHVEVSVNVTPVAPPVTIAPPVVVPPVTAVAPPITVDKPAIETFAQLMSWLTSRTPKDEAAKPAMVTRVNEILAANGLTTLQQLGQRADLIPQVLVQFREAFGE